MHSSRVAEVWRVIEVVSLDTSQIRLPSSPDAQPQCCMVCLLKEDPTFLLWGLRVSPKSSLVSGLPWCFGVNIFSRDAVQWCQHCCG